MSLPHKLTNILVCEEAIVVSENNSIRVFIRQCSLNVSRTQEIVRTFNHYIASYSYALSSSSSPFSHSSSPTSSKTTTRATIARETSVSAEPTSPWWYWWVDVSLVVWLDGRVDGRGRRRRKSEDNIKASRT